MRKGGVPAGEITRGGWCRDSEGIGFGVNPAPIARERNVGPSQNRLFEHHRGLVIAGVGFYAGVGVAGRFGFRQRSAKAGPCKVAAGGHPAVSPRRQRLFRGAAAQAVLKGQIGELSNREGHDFFAFGRMQ